MITERAFLHCGKGILRVKPPESLEIGIGDDGDRVISHHGIGLIGGQLPHGEISALVLKSEHGGDKAVDAIGRHQSVERMRRTVSIPERVRRIVRVPFRNMNSPISTPIPAVNVAEDRRRKKGMIERRGKNLLHAVISTSNADTIKRAFPCAVSGVAHGMEVPSRNLGVQILQRILRRHGRDPDLDEKGMGGVGMIVEKYCLHIFPACFGGSRHRTFSFIEEK